ncbi:MAG: lactate utilization protein B/C [Marivirga sp.]|nr:lactate utilization protein B/C [Marivirga sp.]
MNSREKILAAVKNNQPDRTELPPLPQMVMDQSNNLVQQFTRTLGNIGGTAIEARNWEEINMFLKDRFPQKSRWVNRITELGTVSTAIDFDQNPHDFENVTLSVLMGYFGVAENGAVWITDDRMGDRALPFICEHLVLVIPAHEILPTMHEAYERIGSEKYNFGTFIAGPSKTADIEQSLVLGAHGPKSMTVFLI